MSEPHRPNFYKNVDNFFGSSSEAHQINEDLVVNAGKLREHFEAYFKSVYQLVDDTCEEEDKVYDNTGGPLHAPKKSVTDV